jgi:hypothetical protein
MRHVWVVVDSTEPDLFWVFSSRKKAIRFMMRDLGFLLDGRYILEKTEVN